ncbi:DUF1493 family protein [Brevundimonas sp. PAMC22021]|uniref:DUF1493 family protein n=1 Tax=Brevundimonas sp. PAMC22021 TaxID=2861285 RepID=UPI001C63940A|nr:DUF1493 family protein [Brevundimonas sp. PAMC22021]QYF86864.1 DUF1493 family protein [Brevundimonas sp. PAMC22021]
MDDFSERFEVDGADYLWYFHHGEEGWSLGALFFKPIYRRVARIPITLATLTEAARTRRWPVVYPPHHVPRRRWDILINRAVIGVWLAWTAMWAVTRLIDWLR